MSIYFHIIIKILKENDIDIKNIVAVCAAFSEEGGT